MKLNFSKSKKKKESSTFGLASRGIGSRTSLGGSGVFSTRYNSNPLR